MSRECENTPTALSLINHFGFADFREIVTALFPAALTGFVIHPGQTEAQAVAIQLLVGIRIVPVHIALQVYATL